jgi:hypothetical protein
VKLAACEIQAKLSRSESNSALMHGSVSKHNAGGRSAVEY